tara:strand:+ start:1560 stop:3422 length:1863 start_codon:yes stop_codon:yes gene_type:complete
MVEASFGSAKDFKTLVSEQKENNKGQEGLKKVLENISNTQDKMAQAQGAEIQEKSKTDAKETEDKREQNRIFKSLQKGILGVGSKVGNMVGILEKSALDAANKAGAGLFSIAKKFLFGAAIIALLKFMDSEDWEQIKQVSEKLLIKLKEFVKSPFWTNLKNLITNPSWETLGKLFEDNFLAATALVGIVGGYALLKTVKVARALGLAYVAMSKGLTSLTDVITGTKKDADGRLRDTKSKKFAPKASRGVFGVGKGLAKLVPGLGLAVTGIFGVIDGVTAGMEEAKKEGATKTSILREGIAGTLSGLTFGFVGQDQISDGLSSLGSKIKSAFTPSEEFKERIGKIFDKENIVSNLKSISNKAKEAFTPSEEFQKKITGIKDTFTTGVTSTFKTVGSLFTDKFKFDSKEETIASAINAFTLPANIVKDSLLGAGALLATRLGFDETSETIQNLNQKSIGQLVTDSFNGIFGFFKDLLNFDFTGLVRKIPGADAVLDFIGIGDEDKVKEAEDLARQIQEAKDRIALSESGENAYGMGASITNPAGFEGRGIQEDKSAIKNLTTELKKLQEEIADSKRTSTSGSTIVNNNVVSGTGGGRGGSGGTGILPYPVKDSSIPNGYAPY